MACDTNPTGAELLVATLVRHGVDTVFGVPGDTGVILYDVFARHTGALRHILARDERHAGYMADGYARTHRRIGVCEASSGGGAVYLAGGLGEAYASSVPVLAITSDIHRRSRGSGAITEIDQEALFGAVTTWCRTAERAADIPALVAEAVATATGGRPGPVALIFPEDVLEEHAAAAVPEGDPVLPAARPGASEFAVVGVAADLARAERPVVFAGGGVHASGAWRELLALAEHGALPVATTIHGKGAVPEDHRLSLGVAGGNGCRGYANDYLAGADAVLIVGSRANSTDTNGYTSPPRDPGVRVAQIDTDASRAGRNFPGSVPLVGDAATVLDQLRDRLPAAPAAARAAREADIAAVRDAWARTAADELPDPGEGRLQPREVIRALHRVFGPRAWVVADPGTPTPNLSAYWESAGEGWRVVIPRGHGPMGYAIPAAIGVAVAHPGERVLCVTTEGSLAMGVGDWETAARLALPITYVVLDNTSMGWIKMLQHLFLERRYFGVDPGPIDPVPLATGMGLPGARATTLDQLDVLVKESVGRQGPSVVHVPVPEHKDAPPPVAPWEAVLTGRSTGRPVY
ncbi:thiamine pyrophosphate-binding protein [Streptomyces sp. NEAU-S77]|uniref:thiamine pyrophosphate-binding protein n=1 Tax=Streptomyces sp. NEAU-S77 TaxID=3411033 RepID=UPI003BA0B11E